MNENKNPDQMTKARWEEMCAQHAALAMLVGQLRHDVRLLQATVLGMAQAQGLNLTMEDRTTPASGVTGGLEDYTALLKLARKGMETGERPPATAGDA